MGVKIRVKKFRSDGWRGVHDMSEHSIHYLGWCALGTVPLWQPFALVRMKEIWHLMILSYAKG